MKTTQLDNAFWAATEAKRWLSSAMTEGRRGGVNELPFDAELLAKLGEVICAIADARQNNG